MLSDYPKWARQVEFGLQVSLGILFLFGCLLYFNIRDLVTGPDETERIDLMVRSIQILGISFVLSVAARFVRRAMIDPPLVLIWAALLVTAAIAAVCAALLYLSVL